MLPRDGSKSVDSTPDPPCRLGYLSGAPRVSTSPEAEAGGPRAHVIGVINGFAALGWSVLPFIVGDRMPRKVVRESEAFVSGSRPGALLSDAGRVLLSVWNARRADRELLGRVDWVYERFAAFQALGDSFRKRGIPWILETNALLYREAATERKSMVLTKWARRRELAAYHACDVLVCPSEALKEVLSVEADVPEEKILVVPNGVDTDLFDPDRRAAERLFDGFTIGFVGSLYPWQGLDTLLHVVAQLRREIDIRVIIAGEGMHRDATEQQIAQLGLKEHVRLLGRVPPERVPALMRGFDLAYSGYVGHAVSAGRQAYGSPLKLYEYLAMATPVVASAVPDAKRLIRDGDNGFLFEPGDPEQLKRAIRTAYRHRDRLVSMGRSARSDMVAHHSWTARVADTVRGARHILAAGR